MQLLTSVAIIWSGPRIKHVELSRGNSLYTKDKKNRQSQSVFKCVHCGHEENADVNAAINILGRSIPNRRKRSALAQA